MDFARFDKMAKALPAECFAAEPDLAVVLGSGWAEALTIDELVCRVAYGEIEGLGAANVKGHAGEFLLYRRKGKLIAAWCGRRHFYEGVGWESVVAAVELSRRMGVKKILLTNAAGGIDPTLKSGDFLVISDHVNLVRINPLVGEHNPAWGERFPDMSEVYDRKLSAALEESVRAAGCEPKRGVYAFNLGPAYETPAEIRLCAAVGISAVGMSTVPEAMVAKASGIKVTGLSLISNAAAGVTDKPLDHAEVVAAGKAAQSKMKLIFEAFLDRI